MIALRNVSFSYEGTEQGNAVSNINLEIKDGEVVILCGESGCGKTTITRLINGLVPGFYKGNLEGDIQINGESIRGKTVQEISRHVGSVFQNPRSQFFNVDSISELVFGCENMKLTKEEMNQRLDRTVQMFDVEKLLNKSLFDMSGGEKQRIACASVSMSYPDIIVLDEPTSNLDLSSVGNLSKIIESWKKDGKTVVVADHRLSYLKDVADRVVFVRDGNIAWEKTAADFWQMDQDIVTGYGLRNPYVSNDLESFIESKKKWQIDDIYDRGNILEIKDLSFSYNDGTSVRVEDVRIPLGSVIGVVGQNGAGKSTLIRCLAGLVKCRGSFYINGEKQTRKKMLKKSYLVMQDVNHQLFTESVKEEIRLSIPKNKSEGAEERIDQIVTYMDLFEYKDLHPMSLSGGQKQRVAIASALASEKEFLFFDEPTSGLDYKHMKSFARCLEAIKKKGITPIVITHDMELLDSCAEYIIRLEKGRVVNGGK
ncbi:MAG: ABC transporter ATP-binding protein [Eubacterium sp.]|nr:ABC transporter ATP-binding protein [Eubacterium sp.]